MKQVWVGTERNVRQSFMRWLIGPEKPHLKTDQEVAQVSRQNQGCGLLSQHLSSNPAPAAVALLGWTGLAEQAAEATFPR